MSFIFFSYAAKKRKKLNSTTTNNSEKTLSTNLTRFWFFFFTKVKDFIQIVRVQYGDAKFWSYYQQNLLKKIKISFTCTFAYTNAINGWESHWSPTSSVQKFSVLLQTNGILKFTLTFMVAWKSFLSILLFLRWEIHIRRQMKAIIG